MVVWPGQAVVDVWPIIPFQVWIVIARPTYLHTLIKTCVNVSLAGEYVHVIPQQESEEWNQRRSFVAQVLAVVFIQLWLITAVYRLCCNIATLRVS
jgi:hypothetical protein